MQVGSARSPLHAAGLVVIVAAAVTGCAASSSSSAGASRSSAPAAVTPLEAVQLAANVSAHVNTFTGTMSMQSTAKAGAASATGGSGDLSMTATFAEQLHPSLLADVTIKSIVTAGTSLPGGMSEIVTPTEMYLKAPYLTQLMHLSKPWLVIPLSAFAKSNGVNLSQLLNQATGNSPLSQSQLLADATSVRQVGTGTSGGVPVTEYTGTIPLNDKMLSKLPSSLKTQVQQDMKTLGLTSEKFTVWTDGQHLTRKLIVTLPGKSSTETVTMTITSIDKPINVTLPPASQTSPLPSNVLG